MKRSSFILLAVFIILEIFALSFARAQSGENEIKYVEGASIVEVVSLKYEPIPVEPGEKFRVYLLVKNVGDEVAKNATCRVIDKFPFRAYSERQKYVGPLSGGREWQIDFLVKVDENATGGTDLLELACTDDPAKNAWTIEKVPIKIQYRYSIVNIFKVKTEPEYIGAGDKGKIILSITNDAENIIKDVVVTLNLKDVPVTPADGVTTKKIRNINRNEIVDALFNVYVMPDADAGFYKIPVEIKYVDPEGNKRDFNSFITLKVGDKPKYYVAVDYIEIDNFGEKINLRFVNNGPMDLKYFNVKVIDGKGFEVKGSDEIYIGDLDSDDYVDESFHASIKADKVEIPLEIDYKDVLGREYKDYVNVTLDKSKVINKTKTDYRSTIFVLILIVLLGYYFYRKRRKSR